MRQPIAPVLFALGLSLCASVHAESDDAQDDPYRYALRTGIFPAAFEAGVNQGYFGSAARDELDLGRRLTIHTSGQAAWANVSGQKGHYAYALRVGVSLNLSDQRDMSALAGTVYPEDTPEVGGRGPGTDHELGMPQSQYGAGAPEHDNTTRASMRRVHALRLGYDFARAVERARPDAADNSTRYLLDTLHAAYLGYGFAEHWNLRAASAGGSPQLGFRRFYVDAMLTLPSLVKSRQIGGGDRARAGELPAGMTPEFLGLGGRIGMEGSIDELIRSARGLGFAYCLELGALPGRSGLAGYLFVGLGLAFDAPLRSIRH